MNDDGKQGPFHRPSETLEEGLERFKAVMLAKFEARAEKHGERSVTLVGHRYLHAPGVRDQLYSHLEEEFAELAGAEHTEEEAEEAVDVSNMAFLLWWRAECYAGPTRRPGQLPQVPRWRQKE